jgi:hypothetical protein
MRDIPETGGLEVEKNFRQFGLLWMVLVCILVAPHFVGAVECEDEKCVPYTQDESACRCWLRCFPCQGDSASCYFSCNGRLTFVVTACDPCTWQGTLIPCAGGPVSSCELDCWCEGSQCGCPSCASCE